jgi:hypothetical protein
MTQRHQGIQREEWSRCQRCNFEYPVSKLVIQKGLKVCTVTCFDNTLVEERPMAIAQALGDQNELEDDDNRFTQDDNDLQFNW